MKIILSIGSFIPLYMGMIAIYINQIFNNNPKNFSSIIAMLIIVVIFIISTISYIIIVKHIKNLLNNEIDDNEIKLKNIKPNKKVYLDYMLVYLLPLFSLSMDLNTFNILLTNFLILIFIYINAKAENFQFNIVLFLKRYEIFVGETINGDEKCILMKEDDYSNLKGNQEKYRFIKFCKDIYILKRKEEV